MIKKFVYFGWILSSVLLLFYSFTQVDLGLTLTKASFWQLIQKSFQYIGYFNRPLSTYIFLFIIFLLFGFYVLTLGLLEKGIIKKTDLWKIIFIVSGILFFSYNAFSYDLFNYIFDARIFTHYHQNPYLFKALDFPGDPMLGFMHWTHRTYPYGPVWLGLTIPFSFLGMGYFLVTFYLFKFIAFLSFLGSVYFIEKILLKTKTSDSSSGVAFFALNPLILIEFLVSAHNDILMIFFAILSIYLLISKKRFVSAIALILSIGIKFATVFILPFYLVFLLSKKGNYQKLFFMLFILMTIPILLASYRTNYQPWYFLYFLTFASFISDRYYVFIPSLIISLVSVLNYVPFLYFGNWNPPIPDIILKLNVGTVLVSFLVILIYFLKKNRFAARKAI